MTSVWLMGCFFNDDSWKQLRLLTLFWFFSDCFVLQRRRPRLPPYGYFGFPQGHPFYPQGYPSYPQGYPEVGTAQPSLSVAMQPFGSAVPPYYPPPFISPGIASPNYPGMVSMKV